MIDLLTNSSQGSQSQDEIVKTIDDSSRDKTSSDFGDGNDHHGNLFGKQIFCFVCLKRKVNLSYIYL